MNDILKRIVLFAVIIAVSAAVFFGCVFIYLKTQDGRIDTLVREYNEIYLSVFDIAASPDEAELQEALDGYLTGSARDKTKQSLVSAHTYMSAGTKTVNQYRKDILGIEIDRREGKTTATVRSYVTFDGWGEYVVGKTQNVKINGICIDVYTLEKSDGEWKIADIKTEYE